jgi:molybdate transport system substrate-binding protein
MAIVVKRGAGCRRRGRRYGAIAAALLATAPAAADTLVFAAASTTNALTEVAELYRAQTGAKVVYSFAASSALARQIEYGAPAAIYVSASPEWMDYLAGRGLIAPGSRGELMRNRLALVAPLDSPVRAAVGPGLALAALIGKGRLALADPDHVPAGIYARQALESLGLWAAAEGKLARLANVRVALALVERGEVPLGVVYRTDAAASAKVRLVGLFPADSHAPIVYSVGLVADHADAAARRFLEFLRRPEARAVLARHGFATGGG